MVLKDRKKGRVSRTGERGGLDSPCVRVVVDPHHVDADPDPYPAFHFDADPEPAFHFDRIRRIHMFLGLLDPDPLVRGMDLDPAPDPAPDPFL
jgi:hypothetical protein